MSKKALNLGFICTPHTSHIQYLDEGLDCSFVIAFGEKFAFFCTNTSTDETDIKCITWSVTNSHMLDGKADSCSQWFLSHLV